MTSRRLFAAGLVLGASSAVVALVYGLLAMAAALIAMTVFGVVLPRYALLAGGWIGLGGTWLVLIGRASVNCAGPDMPCGATPPDTTWLLAVATALTLGGCLAGLVHLRTSAAT